MSTGPTTGRHTLPARWLAQALAVAMLLLVAGCGGDSVGDTTTLTADNATAAVTPTSAAVTTTTAAVAVAGLVWSRVQHDEAIFADPRGQQGMLSVTAGGPGLVAVGWDESGGDGDAAVWTSRDGLSWSRLPHDESIFGGPGRQVVYSVVVGGPGLVAVGSDCSGGDWGDCDAAVWTSRDGLIWSRVPHDGAVLGGPGWQLMFSVTVGGPGLVAVGRAVWTSADGLIWSRVPHDEGVPGGGTMLEVTAGGPGLVAVGWEGETYEGDTDAAVWVSPPPG
ncbi:MAG: hypothetical protein FJW79_02115 [Actinobacteria bacterium]|nr:hypothetical protein [Actinomycetota bacterium]